jgi:transposase-like protein
MRFRKSALRSWVIKSKPISHIDGPISRKEENKALRKENTELKMEKEIVNKLFAPLAKGDKSEMIYELIFTQNGRVFN